MWVVPQPRTAHPFVLPLGDSPTGILPCQARNHPIAGFCKSLYFHNLSASRKRRHADAIALAFCDERDQFDELWDYLKEKGVTGRTYSAQRRTT